MSRPVVVTWNPPDAWTVQAIERAEKRAIARWMAEVPDAAPVRIARDGRHEGPPRGSGYTGARVAGYLAEELGAAAWRAYFDSL